MMDDDGTDVKSAAAATNTRFALQAVYITISWTYPAVCHWAQQLIQSLLGYSHPRIGLFGSKVNVLGVCIRQNPGPNVRPGKAGRNSAHRLRQIRWLESTD